MTRIYHNPRCSKSRETVALLREQGIEPEIIEYLRTPQTVAELSALLEIPGIEAQQLLRVKDAAWRELQLELAALTDAEIVAILAAQPALIERPIVIHNGRACLGRPPENVRDIL
ncbi:MAG: arsenate reductase [Rhodothermales bacterium]|jgi:arsenate reductase